MATLPENDAQQALKMIGKVVERKNLVIAYKSVVGNKGSGQGKRLLGIPTVFDRLINQAIHQVLSPMWEPDFSDSSFGFRPNRNAGQAIKQAQAYINAGYQDIVNRRIRDPYVRWCEWCTGSGLSRVCRLLD